MALMALAEENMASRGGGQGPREETSQDPATDPVLCSPYDPPDQHWPLDEFGQAVRGKPPIVGRRRPVSINVPQDRKSGRQQALTLKDRKVNELVEEARAAIKQWRADGYEGVTPTTLRLLQHWNDPQAPLRLFFAQVEAMETLIWLREVAIRTNLIRRELENAARQHNDDIVRLCSKMATGTGKTAVMGMVIAWQTLNAVQWQRTRNIMHTNRFVVFAPGHTVRQRLGVLAPSTSGNVYDEMGLVPQELRQLLNQAKVRVVNFQAFTQKELIDDSKARQLLGKERGEDTESRDAAVRRVLGGILEGQHQGVCVINDEAHHCYLPPPRQKSDSEQKAEDGRAAVWFNTIRAMRNMGALGEVDPVYGQAHPVLDFSATPLWIDTASKSEPKQFQWVASDFGLMDAIESGLVKVPRVPIDDDSIRDETVWRRLYANTQHKNLTKHLQSDSQKRLPDPFHDAVVAVVNDWEKALRAWEKDGQPTPPVIIFVVNSTQNATALYNYIAGYEDENGKAHPGVFPELSNVDPNGSWHPHPRTLVVHSKVGESDAIPDPLKRLLAKNPKRESEKDTEVAVRVREMVNTVGKSDQPGKDVRCVVSVSMLTEGWDARTVTHIVGFRAFSTQLLCEQVTGRALRRTSYDLPQEPDANGRQRFEPEYADVVGIPFEFMPDVGEPTVTPRLPKPRTRVKTVPGRQALRVAWPQVVEYLRIAPQGQFVLELDRVAPWHPAPSSTASMTELAGAVGEPSIISTASERARERTAQAELAAKIASSLTQESRDDGRPEENDEDRDEMRSLGETSLFRSAFKAVGQWAAHPAVGNPDLIELAANGPLAQRATNAILGACDFYTNQPPRRARLAHPPIADTAKVDFETTLVHIHEAQNSELSHAACHSQLEKATAQALDHNQQVIRWVRNFQLGWTIPYYLNGVWRRYEPDFVAVLEGGVNLVVECKGVWDEKATAAAEWAENYWVPSLAGTVELPDHLRQWAYGVIDDPQLVKFHLDHAIQTALQKEQ